MIRILENSVINKIAAGEVIERPASVVKELIENSLDAGSTQIKIEVLDSGLKKIKISDNGEGMSRHDALLCFKRHATSKIENEKDLFSIGSLGFRGEAIASIAEISSLKIITRKESEDAGTFIEIESGEIVKTDSIGCSVGSIMEVSNLFFNVPARKKYLKSRDVEFSRILDTVTRYALLRKDVSIKIIHNDKEILNSHKTGSLLKNIIFIYGAGIASNLIKVDYKEQGISAYGYISKPSMTRHDKHDQSLYVNDRYVKNSVITDAVYDAYKTLLFINRHPVFVLSISIAPKDIDVNVHPSKTTIRLKNEEMVSRIIFNAIKKALEDNDLAANASTDNETTQKPLKNYGFSRDRQTVLVSGQSLAESLKKEPELAVIKKENNSLVSDSYILGQVNKTFIVAENSKDCL